MNTFIDKYLMPIATKLSTNKALVAIRDGLTLGMPLIIIGSLFMIIASFPAPGWEEWLGQIGIASYLWKGVDGSFGILGLIGTFGVAHSLATQYKKDGVSAGVIAVSAFLTVTPQMKGDDGIGIPAVFFGARGVFVAIIIALLSAYIFHWFIERDIQIKLPEAVPPAVSRSFSAIIPGAAIISLALFVYSLLDAFSLPHIHDIVQNILGKPLSALSNNVFGTALVAGLNSLFWFVGIHGGNVVNSLFSPVWIANLDANKEAYRIGEALPNIITGPFMDNFVYIGGGGATFGLVIGLALLAKHRHASQQTKTLAPLTIAPGIFNINEPAMFGIPIVLNLRLVIPFILVPIVNVFIAYTAMSTGLVPLTRAVASWTMPPILSGFLTTGSIAGALLQVVIIIVDILLYLPFYRSVEKEFQAMEHQS
ncbi:PTS sugar transporter subunit IIC [Aerococcaceae bacterium NML160702]|nr:PTS sugar transporter subunit IIC [Aerococcaceae bacterium NML160702]